VAIVVPAISSIAPNEVLGLVLIFVGIVQIAQSGKMKGEAQFAWHLALGLVAAIGGVFVYLDPFEGVVTLTILMAIVFALHGLTQIAFALRVRRLRGWSWFLLSGCVALVVAALLVMKLPYGHTFTSATVGGVPCSSPAGPTSPWRGSRGKHRDDQATTFGSSAAIEFIFTVGLPTDGARQGRVSCGCQVTLRRDRSPDRNR
jgi:uncharacterized membrane protein HdeD (DUF308 family)